MNFLQNILNAINSITHPTFGIPGHWALLILAVLVVVVIASRKLRRWLFVAAFCWYFLYRRIYPDARRGLYLGPVLGHLVLFLLTALVAAIPAALTFWVATRVTGSSFAAALAGAGTEVAFLALIWSFNETRQVPAAHVAIITFVGRPIKLPYIGGVYLTVSQTGYLIPSIFATYRTPVQNPLVGTYEGDDENPGLVYIGNQPFPIIDRDITEGEPKSLSAIANDRTIVHLKPTVELTCFDPLRRIDEGNVTLTAEDAIRTLLRLLIGRITSVQANEFQSSIADWMTRGTRAMIVRTRYKSAKSGFLKGDVVKRAAEGTNMVGIIPSGTSETEANNKIKEFLLEVENDGDPRMVDAAKAVDGKMGRGETEGDIRVTIFNLSDKLHNTLDRMGFRFAGIPHIGDIDAPEAYTSAAADSGAEIPRRQVALADARTEAEAAEIRRTEGLLDKQTAALITAAEDNPDAFRVIHLTGASDTPVIVNATS